MVRRHCQLTAIIGAALVVVVASAPVSGVTPGNDAFQHTWARTDGPVAALLVSRTWMWGPEATSPLLLESYDEAPGGQRVVQYFDKSRMEITHPDAPDDGVWYVTNGRLASELITGQMQLGDARTVAMQPAAINVAGDAGDPNGPNYATFSGLLSAPAAPDGATLTQRVARDGSISDDAALAAYGVTAAQHVTVPGIDHQVASVFWTFMNATGLVDEDGDLHEEALFQNPYYATGYPITEAYWTTIAVSGVAQNVLLQCFERRCLTYTPSDAAGWQVEAGNVGQHYYQWRYAATPPTPAPPPPPAPAPETPTTGNVQITFILYDSPEYREHAGEYVVLTNEDDHAVQLQGWRLTDAGPEHTYRFPAFVLAAGASVTLHECDGASTASDLYTGSCNPWWNNDGDTGYLYDATGALVSTYAY